MGAFFVDKAMKKAYSQLNVTSIDEAERKIYGIATTPSPDRADDIIEPKGAVFTLPVPFLWQHKHDKPIGQVIEANVQDDGIHVVIQLADPNEMQSETLKERLTEAWDSIKSGLVRGLSVGFKGIETNDIKGTWGWRYVKWDWYELSAVTIPANQEATITAIKSFDSARCYPAPTVTPEQQQKVIHLTEKQLESLVEKAVIQALHKRLNQSESSKQTVTLTPPTTGVKL